MAFPCSNTHLVWTASSSQSSLTLSPKVNTTISNCARTFSHSQSDLRDHRCQANSMLKFSSLPRSDLSISMHAWLDLYPAIKVARELSALLKSIRVKMGLGFNARMVAFLRKTKNAFGILALGTALLQLKIHAEQIVKQTLSSEKKDRLLALCKKSAHTVEVQILQHFQLDICRGLREIRTKHICTVSAPKPTIEGSPSKKFRALIDNLETHNPSFLSTEEVTTIARTAQSALYDRAVFPRLGEIHTSGGLIPSAICYALHHHKPTISVLPYKNTYCNRTSKSTLKLTPKDQKRLIHGTYPESLFLT